jgi:hypothetical protein
MKNAVATVVAVVVSVVYVIGLVLMWSKVGDADPVWARRLVLLAGLEAIVFAAIGWLFGKEVNRHAVDSAATANEKAREDAQARGEAEGKGQALADAVRATSDTEGFESAPATGGASLRALADQLFPRTP